MYDMDALPIPTIPHPLSVHTHLTIVLLVLLMHLLTLTIVTGL